MLVASIASLFRLAMAAFTLTSTICSDWWKRQKRSEFRTPMSSVSPTAETLFRLAAVRFSERETVMTILRISFQSAIYNSYWISWKDSSGGRSRRSSEGLGDGQERTIREKSGGLWSDHRWTRRREQCRDTDRAITISDFPLQFFSSRTYVPIWHRSLQGYVPNVCQSIVWRQNDSTTNKKN